MEYVGIPLPFQKVSKKNTVSRPGDGPFPQLLLPRVHHADFGQAPRIILVVAAVVVLKFRELSRHRIPGRQFQRGRSRVRVPLSARPRRSSGRYRRRGIILLFSLLILYCRRHPASKAAYCTGVFRLSSVFRNSPIYFWDSVSFCGKSSFIFRQIFVKFLGCPLTFREIT